MGQYYKPALIRKGRITVYDRSVEPDGDYVLAKLMEHSWWNNPTCNAVAKLLYKQKGVLFWCGDYADDQAIHRYIWDTEGKGLPDPKDFKLDGKVIVNHSQKIFLDCDEYKQKSMDKDGWCVHPLSLLTALGNGRGGGDYYEEYPHADEVGKWAGDTISIEDKDYVADKKLEIYEVIFKERQ